MVRRRNALASISALLVFALTGCSTPSETVEQNRFALPGSQLAFQSYPVQKSASDPGNWGSVLLDIEKHLPSSYGTQYQDSDKQTHGHETTHGINSDIRNYHNKTGKKANGFYLLESRAVVLVEPGILKNKVAAFVPSALRGFRFPTYITGQTAWDDTPTYVFDEWIAYINGSTVGVNRYEEGKWSGTPGTTYGVVDGALEFSIYAIALARAVHQLDPQYVQTYPQFDEFVAFNLVRAMDVFRQGDKIPPFQIGSQKTLFAALMSAAGAPLRDFVAQRWSQAFADRVFLGTPMTTTPDLGVPLADQGTAPRLDNGGPALPDSGLSADLLGHDAGSDLASLPPRADAGAGPGRRPTEGCAVDSSAPSSLSLSLLLLLLLGLARRRR